MLDAENGNEASYQFSGPPDLMKQVADDVIGVFFNEVDHEILGGHVDWELNGALNNRERGVVTAIGSLLPKEDTPPIPFLLMISDHNGQRALG
jgi:hypothetical protein